MDGEVRETVPRQQKTTPAIQRRSSFSNLHARKTHTISRRRSANTSMVSPAIITTDNTAISSEIVDRGNTLPPLSPTRVHGAPGKQPEAQRSILNNEKQRRHSMHYERRLSIGKGIASSLGHEEVENTIATDTGDQTLDTVLRKNSVHSVQSQQSNASSLNSGNPKHRAILPKRSSNTIISSKEAPPPPKVHTIDKFWFGATWVCGVFLVLLVFAWYYRSISADLYGLGTTIRHVSSEKTASDMKHFAVECMSKAELIQVFAQHLLFDKVSWTPELIHQVMFLAPGCLFEVGAYVKSKSITRDAFEQMIHAWLGVHDMDADMTHAEDWISQEMPGQYYSLNIFNRTHVSMKNMEFLPPIMHEDHNRMPNNRSCTYSNSQFSCGLLLPFLGEGLISNNSVSWEYLPVTRREVQETVFWYVGVQWDLDVALAKVPVPLGSILHIYANDDLQAIKSISNIESYQEDLANAECGDLDPTFASPKVSATTSFRFFEDIDYKLSLRTCFVEDAAALSLEVYVFTLGAVVTVMSLLYVFSGRVLHTSLKEESLLRTYASKRFFSIIRSTCNQLRSQIHSVLYFSECALTSVKDGSDVSQVTLELQSCMKQCLQSGRHIRSIVSTLAGIDTMGDLEKFVEMLVQGIPLNQSIYSVTKDVISRVRVNLTYLDSNVVVQFRCHSEMQHYFSTQNSYYIGRLLLLGFGMAIDRDPEKSISLSVTTSTGRSGQHSSQHEAYSGNGDESAQTIVFRITCSSQSRHIANSKTSRSASHDLYRQIMQFQKVKRSRFQPLLGSTSKAMKENPFSKSGKKGDLRVLAKEELGRSFFVKNTATKINHVHNDEDDLKMQLGSHLADSLGSELHVKTNRKGQWSFQFAIGAYRDGEQLSLSKDPGKEQHEDFGFQSDSSQDSNEEENGYEATATIDDPTVPGPLPTESSVVSDSGTMFATPEQVKNRKFSSDLSVLHCDDDEACRMIITRMVKQFGVEDFTSVSTAEEVIDYLANPSNPNPHLLMIDIELEGMSGEDALQHIRNNFPAVGAPAIAITGHSRMEEVQHLLTLGFKRVVVKPYGKELLYKAILAALSDDKGTTMG